MASQWRGGPNVKGTLGTLLRTTMHQVGVVKDAAVRQARTQRVWIDSAMLARRRRDVLAQIGEQAVERVRAGGSEELARWPELEPLIEELDNLDAEIEEAATRSREAVPAVSAVSAALGRTRAQPEVRARRPEDVRVWRPVDPDAAPAEPPDADPDPEATPPARGEARRSRISPKGRGGISFGNSAPADLDDDDLEAYMHEDDVPSEPTR